MTPERYQLVKKAFQALEESGGEFTGPAPIDESLRREAKCLFDKQKNNGDDFLESPVISLGNRLSEAERRIFAPGEIICGRWEIKELLGYGGMGEVYRALDLEFKEDIALKTIRSRMADSVSVLDRFRREIQLARKIADPHICKMYDLFTHKNADGQEIRFVTMELVRGETLAARLEEGALEPSRALQLARQLIGGLSAAHGKGIVHGDFKSSNVMVSAQAEGEEHAVIMDFGLARMLSAPETPDSAVADDRGPEGTPGYMAPEQWANHEISIATDVYALGVVLYEMITGKHPFGKSVSDSLVGRQKSGTMPAPRAVFPGIDPGWERAIVRCLEPDPANRFQSVEEVLAALDPAAPPKPNNRVRKALAWSAAGLAIPLGIWLAWRAIYPAPPSVLVLPIETVGTPTQVNYASGIEDELIGTLARVPKLRVMPTGKADRSGTPQDPAVLARRLGADRVISGTVGAMGSELRVSIKVSQPGESHVLWSQQFHRPAGEAFQLFHEVGAAVGNELAPANEEVKRRAGHVPDAEAYKLYLDGMYFYKYHSVSAGNAKLAAAKFEEAIRKDSMFSDAYSGLVAAYSITGAPAGTPANQFEVHLHDLANHAWELDPTSPEALAALANLAHHSDLNFVQAGQYLRKALTLQPGNPDIHQSYASLLSDTGNWGAAKNEFTAALTLDPLSPSIRSSRAIYLFLSRRYKEARQEMEQILRGPQGYRVHPYLGAMYLAEGKIQDGLREYELGVRNAGSDGIARGHQAYGLAKAGRQKEARRLLAELGQTDDPDRRDPFYMATAYGALHDYDQAFRWLEQGFAEHDWSLCYLKIHPYCDDLRADPHFSVYLSRLKMK